MIQIKRAYEETSPTDGYRILVDRLWPRGMSKEKEHLDVWLKTIAPSNELRKWFGHDPTKFAEFKEKYIAELRSADGQKSLQELVKLMKEQPTLTLIYSAKDEKNNNAVVLKEILEKMNQAKF
ncbi:DUF488 domain-containing protein [Enterococcus caccae]|uniref:MarR family transcriptional regulator n=1 Tax=Enterococcus caccae ATCC BAA-1240 TaxID=1158612 RepID=R3WLV0_9ENTE|nr:DUF488 domain-containing protein [Enterococcus caccae]EOL42840.1 hypothetical protein UC7_03248 [Enterococcus caccae ATCC BAA-1240]EOT67682.1 hypothetical protein I580_00064 [Enterococcus caccae ATCC BAA-1240]